MSQAKEFSNLYAELHRCEQNEDFVKALKLCNKILQISNDEVTAFHCKVVCTIRLNRFDDALGLIKKSKFDCDLAFEKAYCEYRMNRVKEAHATLLSIKDQSDRVQELLAQVLYRLEDYKECVSVYRNLVKNTQDSYEEERATNLSAVLAALQMKDPEDTVDNSGLSEDSYELCYNTACFMIAQGQLQEAMEKLKQAEAMCREFFEDDPEATEEEIESELGIIKVQQAYILQKQGLTGEAMKLNNNVLKSRPTDVSLSAIASNNVITLNKDQNVFDSKKKIRVATADGLNHKLTSKQREKIAYNQCLLFMYSGQGEQCIRTAQTLRTTYPGSSMPAMIEAAQHCKDKNLAKATQSLQSQLDTGSSSVEMQLTLAQLYLTQGKVYDATRVLRSMGSLSYKPGIVSALVTLYMNQEDYSSASKVLNEAVDYYKTNQIESSEYKVLMKANAHYQLKHGDPKIAASLLEELHKLEPNDLKTMAQLITAYSKFDAKKAQSVSKQLPSPEELAADVDVDALEASANLLGPKYVKKSTQKTDPSSPVVAAKRGGDDENKKKKKRKVKLPKNFDPNKEIDPERWLPRRERSYYRGKRKDKRKEIGKGTQGASAAAAAEFDASKTASPGGSSVGSPKPGSAAATPKPTTSTAGPRQQKPGGGAKKKKKKKGGNW